MSLDKRLTKSKDKGDEKVITLRMPQNKVTLLEILSKHYGINMSTLMREIIDEGIAKLAKEHLVVSEDAGYIHTNPITGEKSNIRFFSDIVDHLVPEIPTRLKREDYCSDKELEDAIFEEQKLSIEYGFTIESSIVTKFGDPDDVGYTFKKQTKVKE